jgi:hypothetical protein
MLLHFSEKIRRKINRLFKTRQDILFQLNISYHDELRRLTGTKGWIQEGLYFSKIGIILDAFKKQLLLCQEFVVEMLHRRGSYQRRRHTSERESKLVLPAGYD